MRRYNEVTIIVSNCVTCKNVFRLAIFAVVLFSSSGSVTYAEQYIPNGVQFNQNYTDFTDILKKAVVTDGPVAKVRYRWLVHHQGKLLRYLKSVSAVTPSIYQKWSKNEKEAFLINAYNGFTIELIVKHYPVTSIKEIGGLFKNPWKIDFISLFQNKVCLDDIEHTLRTKFDDPRIHFAINCASVGCPPLLNEAYVANRLDHQLNEQAKRFLRDGFKNQIDVANKTLRLSKIFDWYSGDFKNKAGSVEKFIAPYITDDKNVQVELMNNKFSISYTDYNWKLNGVVVPKVKSHFWQF